MIILKNAPVTGLPPYRSSSYNLFPFKRLSQSIRLSGREGGRTDFLTIFELQKSKNTEFCFGDLTRITATKESAR